LGFFQEDLVGLRGVVRRVLVSVGVVGVLGVVVGLGGGGVAAASTIPNGHVQICAQGSYPVFIHILSAKVPNSGGLTTETLQSTITSPNQGSNSCWWTQFDTFGQSVQVDVVGLHSNGKEFYIGSKWWNSSTGLGIGAEGSESSPWLQTW
jgi:hypothetical protein